MHSQMQALLQAMLTSQIRSPLPLISYLLTCYSFQLMLTTHLPKHRWKIRLCYLVDLLITFTSQPYSGVFLLRCRILICYWVLQLQERMVPSCPNTNNLPPCMSLVLTAICFKYYSPLPLPHRYYFRRLHPLIPYICTFWYPISNCEASIPQLQHPIGVLYSILRSNLPDSMLHTLITLLLSALARSSSVSLNIMCSTELSWYSMMPSAWYFRLLVSSVYWRGSYIYISPSIPPNAIYYPLLDMLMQVTLVSSAYLRIFSVLVISCSTSVSMVLHLPYSTEQDRLGIMTPLLASNFNAEVMRVSSLLRSTCWWVQLRIRPMMFSLRWRVGGLWYIAFCYVCSQMYYILRLLSRQSPNLAARHCLYTKWAAWNASLSMRSSRMSQYRSNRVSYDSVMQLSYLNNTSHLPSMIIDSKYFRSMMLRQICDSSCSVLQVWGKLFSCRNCKISWIICESLSSVVAGLWVACIYEHSIINYLSYKYLISTMYQNIENLKPQPAKCAKFIRMINLTTGALVVAFGLVGIIFMAIHNLFSLKFFLIFSPIFIIIFGVALLAIQLKSAFILENFGFLKTLLGRGLFNFYVSTEVYYYFSCSGTDNPVLAWTSSMVLFGIGVLYLVLHFTVGRGYANDLKQQLG